MKVGIIGCGLIGRKRVLSLQNDDILVACCDINEEIGIKFSEEFKCDYFNKYSDLIKLTDCDIIIVSVINKFAKEIVLHALKHNKHVLLEKPMGRNVKESLSMYNESLKHQKIFKIGFNHRFHPAIRKAKELLNSIGKILFIRAHYGHGGRPYMETEWRASKDLCGGGELLDQGVHLIDLCRWFVGEVKSVFGQVETKFWDIEVEDNAFMLLKIIDNTDSNQYWHNESMTSVIDAQLHVSWTNWKNSFQFEIYGSEGYLKINGLGGWYGKETLEFGLKNLGKVPNIRTYAYDSDDSWAKEWENLKESINNNVQPIGNYEDGLKANTIIEAVYKSSLKNKIIKL